MSERERLTHIEQAQGYAEAVDFAKRTLKLYRRAVLTSRKRGYSKPHHASLKEYRRGFIESYCIFKQYLG